MFSSFQACHPLGKRSTFFGEGNDAAFGRVLFPSALVGPSWALLGRQVARTQSEECNVVVSPEHFFGQLGRILATSAATSPTYKRDHLSDYRPLYSSKWTDIKANGNGIVMRVFQATLITAVTGLNEYNAYLDKVLAIEENPTLPAPAPFDWDLAFVRWFNQLRLAASRQVGVYIIRKHYELLAVLTLSRRMADRLCKDISLCLKRLLSRYTRFEASKRIFRNVLYSNVTVFASVLTYDVLSYVPEAIEARRIRSTPWEATLWLGKRAILYGASSTFSAAGYSVGVYLVGNDWGSTLVQTAFEAVGTATVSALLDI